MIETNAQRSAVTVYTIHASANCASACAPAGLAKNEIEDDVNGQYPTGTRSRWRIATTAKFAGGEPNGCPCTTDPRRRHWLLSC